MKKSSFKKTQRKRIYPNHFTSKMSDAEASETMVWLDFARDCSYLAEKDHHLCSKYQRVGRMFGGMIKHPKKFAPR